MREIKFRAWDKDKKEMSTPEDIESILRGASRFNVYGNIEPMQFIGLHDKNGKEIYEGDIVKTKFGIIGDIQFLDGCFCLHREYADDCLSYYTNLTVIGNIYENPELSSLAAG